MKAPSRHIAIIGGGFSGTTLAVRLLETLRGPATISLIDAGGRFGPGLAYGTPHPFHFMNTRASAISAVFGQPHHFANWLATRPDGAGQAADAFVPRHFYGAYLGELLEQAERRSDIALARVADEAIGVVRGQLGFRVPLASGRRIEADTVIIATGYGVRGGGGHRSRIVWDPWAGDWWGRVSPDDAVILRGTGLTMVDQVLRLASTGHRGPVLAVSRHGLLPRVHTDMHAPQTAPRDLTRPAPALRALVRDVRREAGEAMGNATPWQAVIDRLRPAAQALWMGWSSAERQRFVRHLRPYWNVHRHRMAPGPAVQLKQLCAKGQLTVRAGRIEPLAEEAGTVSAAFRPRGAGTTEVLTAHWLIDCADVDRLASAGALGWSLFSQGYATRTGNTILSNVGSDGRFRQGGDVVEGLFGIGPVAKEALGEITAIPEIRSQCFALADEIALSAPARVDVRARNRSL